MICGIFTYTCVFCTMTMTINLFSNLYTLHKYTLMHVCYVNNIDNGIIQIGSKSIATSSCLHISYGSPFDNFPS